MESATPLCGVQRERRRGGVDGRLWRHLAAVARGPRGRVCRWRRRQGRGHERLWLRRSAERRLGGLGTPLAASDARYPVPVPWALLALPDVFPGVGLGARAGVG